MQLAHVKLATCTCLIRSYAAVRHDDKMMSDQERADYKKAWQLFADEDDKNDDFTPLPRGLIRDIDGRGGPSEVLVRNTVGPAARFLGWC